MNTIKVETGVQQYQLNDAVTVAFNPTDSAFVERLFEVFDTLDKQQEAYKAEVQNIRDNRQIFSVARRRDAEMRELVDSVFDAPVCQPLFGGMNIYAIADGLPVWCNLLLAIMDEVDTTFSREQKATNPRIQKYTAKYHK